MIIQQNVTCNVCGETIKNATVSDDSTVMVNPDGAYIMLQIHGQIPHSCIEASNIPAIPDPIFIVDTDGANANV